MDFDQIEAKYPGERYQAQLGLLLKWHCSVVTAYVFHLTEGWMTCDFTSLSTVFQSYQDDGLMIIPCLRLERFPPEEGLKYGTAR